jgi:hypothetical protein
MTLVLQWPIDHHFGASFNDLFDFHLHSIHPDTSFSFDLGGDKYNYVDDDLGNNKDSPIVFLNRSIFAKSNCVLHFEGMDYSLMSQLLRNLPIHSHITNSVLSLPSYTIGVHIRMDSNMLNSWEIPSNYSSDNFDKTKLERTKSHYSNFVSEMLKIEESHPDWLFFVCTDTPSILPKLKHIFGSKLLCYDSYLTSPDYDSSIVSRSSSSIIDAFVDMLTLSKCNALLGSSWSSFTEVCQYFKPSPFDFIKIVGVDF